MFKSTYILIRSKHPDERMTFYRDVLELPLNEKVDIPERNGRMADYGYEFQLTPHMQLWIGRHADGTGKSKGSARIMHNLYTDDVEGWYEKVKQAGSEILTSPVLIPFATDENPTYGATFLDPDGNAWQFMGTLHLQS